MLKKLLIAFTISFFNDVFWLIFYQYGWWDLAGTSVLNHNATPD